MHGRAASLNIKTWCEDFQLLQPQSGLATVHAARPQFKQKVYRY